MTPPRVIRIAVPSPGTPRRLDEYGADEWRAAMVRSLGGAIEAAQEAVLELLPEGGGVILVVSAMPGDAAARTSVAGLHGLVRSIAKEYGGRHIRCNLLVGEASSLERLLTENTAITGEMLVAGDDLVGAAGLDGGVSC